MEPSSASLGKRGRKGPGPSLELKDIDCWFISEWLSPFTCPRPLGTRAQCLAEQELSLCRRKEGKKKEGEEEGTQAMPPQAACEHSEFLLCGFVNWVFS
jgi:hypothetical protein